MKHKQKNINPWKISEAVTQKTALITGITGQDGSYLAEFLLSKGYKVYGMVRSASTFNRSRIDHLHNFSASEHNLELLYGDLTDTNSLHRIFQRFTFDEVYNLGAQSHVRISFEIPEYTANAVALGTLRLLEVMRHTSNPPKYYQASSSEMFGKVQQIPQVESTPFYPRSPYGVSKVFAFWITKSYREGYGMFNCNGILFNHESPRRGENFVTRKITLGVSRIVAGLQNKLLLGNLDAKRDWGYAGDYVRAMWCMLQQAEPDDYVIATGENYSVRECVEEAFRLYGIPLEWQGQGLHERGMDARTGRILVVIDDEYFRPTEVDFLLGSAAKARARLGWEPSVKFKQLVRMMMEHDREVAKKELRIRGMSDKSVPEIMA